jgi:hypothetical protein
MRSLEALGRVQLSRTLFMRDFLFSEIAAVQRISNVPSEPDIAVAAGRELCVQLLEPLQATFGRLSIRSAYRSSEVNAAGHVHKLGWASNDYERARHIWDRLDGAAMMGAKVVVVVPWLIDRSAEKQNWQSMAWWIHDHLPYSEVDFFPQLGVFDIAWHQAPKRTIQSVTDNGSYLIRPGDDTHGNDHRQAYIGFPALATRVSLEY